MYWDWMAISAVGTLSLAFVAVLAIVIPIVLNRRQQNKDRKKQALDQVIQWAENVLAIITKYSTVHFEQLEDLLVRANVLKAEQYSIIIKADSVNQNLKTLVRSAIREVNDFVEQADKHVGSMGRKQRIKVPTNLEPTVVDLIRTAAKLREVL